MGQDAVSRILQSRQPAEPPAAPPTEPVEGDKFFSILLGEGLYEHFLELRFKAGMRTCFAYNELMWFNFDPENGSLDLEFGGYLITVAGRGLGERLFDGIKQKRVAWIKEADVELQDNAANKVFIKEILITPPSTGEESAEE